MKPQEELNHKTPPKQVMKATDIWDDETLKAKRLHQKLRIALFVFLLIGVFFEVGYFTTITFLLIYGRWEWDRYDDISEMIMLRMWQSCLNDPNFKEEMYNPDGTIRLPEDKS